jgi:hypothetical protein
MDGTDQIPGKISGSLDFDGIDDTAEFPHHASIDFGDESLSYMFWIRGVTPAGENRFLLKGTNSGGCGLGRRYELRNMGASGSFWFVLDDNVTKTEFSRVEDPYLDGTWHHLVFTREVSTDEIKVYFDGSQYDVIETDSSTDISNTCPLYLARDDSGSQFTSVNFDEVIIMGRALEAEWIETSFNNQNDPTGFCQVCDATPTAVELVSFDVTGLDSEVELAWETGSELRNLGFHLYRSEAEAGPYERITTRLIPGLGSSPAGNQYRYLDRGLTNGAVYYYKLEDVETTGRTKLHGPVSATPKSGAANPADSPTDGTSSLTTYGDPTKNELRVLERDRNGLLLELTTEGFYVEPSEDGTVRLVVPGLEDVPDGDVSIPVARTWIEAVAGRKVDVGLVREMKKDVLQGVWLPGAEVVELVASPRGTVRAAHRRRGRPRVARSTRGLEPTHAAQILDVGFQGDMKKALVELAPLRWDGSTGRLHWTRRLLVKIAFHGREPGEVVGRGRRRAHRSRSVLARLVTTDSGLHKIRFEDLFGRRRRAIAADKIRLSRQGETVPFHIEPCAESFGRHSTLYFISEGARANPYGHEAVYELEVGKNGVRMEQVSASPTGEVTPFYWKDLHQEENHLYYSSLLEAPDLWLWDMVFAPATKTYPFKVSGLELDQAGSLSVWLQGASDFPATPDHHIRLFVNGTLLDDVSWDGKKVQHVDVTIPTGVLREGDNTLEIENVGDTGADYSMVLLDRFAVRYPRTLVAGSGKLMGTWKTSGVTDILGLEADAIVLDVTEKPRWLTDSGAGRFRVEAGRRYLAVNQGAVLRPEVRRPAANDLANPRNRADYLVIGPSEFLDAASDLLELRQQQGLEVRAVATESIFSEFGYGEPSPKAVRDFIAYAYHHWQEPSPRYVLLVGDATYDFKDYLQTGMTNAVPPWLVKTSYLWTASDPAYAAVNGEDLMPDLAIGRLPAASVDELRTMIEKILAYESGTSKLEAPFVLIADNADHAGNFEADAEEISAGLLSSQTTRKIYLSRLGAGPMRGEILSAFDEGSSLMSYMGHGGIHLWADENIFNTDDVSVLATQSRQPLVLTMNCLNGYFHFPYFDSLAEGLLKAEGKGAVAAFSPSGLSLNTPAHRYHKALLEALLNGNHKRLGDAVLAAQEAYLNTGAFPELLAIYHLLGDPALRIH